MYSPFLINPDSSHPSSCFCWGFPCSLFFTEQVEWFSKEGRKTMLHFCSKPPVAPCFTQCQCFIFSSPFPRAFAHAIPLTCKTPSPVDGQGSFSSNMTSSKRISPTQWPLPQYSLCSFLRKWSLHPLQLTQSTIFYYLFYYFYYDPSAPTWMKIPCGQSFCLFYAWPYPPWP